MTIKEIAQQANVSVATVDRVIHNRGYVNKERRALIEKIIADSGFKPNMYARNLKLNQVVRVAFLTPVLSSENGYWDYVYKGVEKASEELSDESFIVEKYEFDRDVPNAFTQVAERMLESKPDGCVIIPKNVDEVRAFLLRHPDLLYVLVDTPVSGVNPLCTIGQNFYRGGILAGRLVSLLQPKPARILTFSFKNSLASKERIRGFKAFYRNQTDIIDLSVSDMTDLPDVIRDAYRQYDDIDAIFCPCSAGYAVGNVAVELGKKEQTKIVTYDLLPQNLLAVSNGILDCVISQRPVYQGYSAIFQIYRYLVKNAPVEKKIEINVDIIFPENVPASFNEQEEGSLNPYCAPSYL